MAAPDCIFQGTEVVHAIDQLESGGTRSGSTSRPNKPNSQICGVITDLHRREVGNVGADPLRKLGTCQVPVLDQVALLAVKGHAGDTINGREGGRNDGKGLAKGGRGQGKVVGVRTGTSDFVPKSSSRNSPLYDTSVPVHIGTRNPFARNADLKRGTV